MRKFCALLAALLLMLGCVPTAAASGDREIAHETHEFTVGSEQEKPYLVKGASLNEAGIRYADVKNEIIYRFDLMKHMNLRTVELSGPLYQQLHLSVSSDGEIYTEVYRWIGEVNANGSGGLKMEMRHFDLTPYLDLADLETVYVRIADSYTSGGWGGAIHPSESVVLDVSYLPPTKEELDAREMRVSEHAIPLFGCNDAIGSGYTLETEQPYAGSGSLLCLLDGGDPSVTFTSPRAVDGTGMDTLELAVYVSDTALFSTPAGGTITLGSAGGGRLSWTMEAAFATVETPQIGWNVVSLPLDAATQKNGFDVGTVCSIALEWDSPVSNGRTLGIDSIRLTDAQAQSHAMAVARIQPLLDAAARLEHLDSETLGEHNFKEVARVCHALRLDYDALTGADAALAVACGVLDVLETTEGALTAYEHALGKVTPEDDAPTVQDGADGPTLTPPATEPDTPAEPTDTNDEAPIPNGVGMHPMIIVTLAVAVGAVLTAAVLVARKKEKAAKK